MCSVAYHIKLLCSLSFSMTKENMELYSEKKTKTKTPQFYSEAQTEKTNM